MSFKHKDGTLSDPMVIKHWRQDWRYEDTDLHVFAGLRSWRQQLVDAAEAAGKWSQTVYQVDDSPRYEALGAWQHRGSFSSWKSGETWRPLPRREFSVRNDYHALVGSNRHTITPLGCVHEEDHLKVILSADGSPASDTPVVARELGLNRYERITGYSFAAGDQYWERTSGFWKLLRHAWRERYAMHTRLSLKAQVEDQRMYQMMFGYARRLVHDEAFDATSAEAFIKAKLDAFLDH